MFLHSLQYHSKSIYQLNSSLLTQGSRMAKKIQYIKTNQMIKVNEIKTIKRTIMTVP